MPDRPRLPLPGEEPTTVFHLPRHQVRRPPARGLIALLFRLAPWLIVAALALVGLRLWRATSTHVTLLVNGEAVEIATHRRTVTGAARTAGYRLDSTLFIDPAADTPLQNGMVIVIADLQPVTVHADGQTFNADTRHTNPYQIVADLGITLEPGDAVRVERAIRPTAGQIAQYPELARVPAVPLEIRVVHAMPIIVRETLPGGQITEVSFTTTEPDISAALLAAGYTIHEADRVSPPASTALDGAPITVAIERAMPVTVHADGRDYSIRTHQMTIDGLLEEMGLAVSGLDYVTPTVNTPLVPGVDVRLVRVTEQADVQQSPIPFGVTYIPDPDLPLDEQRLVQPGRDGILEQHIRARLEDGQVVSQVVTGQWMVEPPQSQVIAYGTRITVRALDTPGGTVYYWRKLRVLATSYSPLTAGHKQPGDPFYGLSGTGSPVQRGIVATDPAVIPLYTWMFVPGYGVGRALDVGGAIKGMRIDLGYDDANLVLWNSWVDIYLLVPVPPYDEIVWVLPE